MSLPPLHLCWPQITTTNFWELETPLRLAYIFSARLMYVQLRTRRMCDLPITYRKIIYALSIKPNNAAAFLLLLLLLPSELRRLDFMIEVEHHTHTHMHTSAVIGREKRVGAVLTYSGECLVTDGSVKVWSLQLPRDRAATWRWHRW